MVANNMITKREAAIISAYTGILLGDFNELHKYIEEIMERPVMTHELANAELVKEIKDRAYDDFISIEVRD